MVRDEYLQLGKSCVAALRTSSVERTLTIWLLSAPAAIVTTNYLVQDRHQHFPYHILILHVVLALAITLVRSISTDCWSTSRGILSWRPSRSDLLSPHRLWRTSYLVFAVLALLSSYQAFFHLPSLVCLTLILTLAPAGASLLCNLALRPSFQSALRATLIVALVFTVFWNDYRLTPNGVAITLLAIGSYLAASFAHLKVLSHEELLEYNGRSPRLETTKVLATALVPLFVCALHSETPRAQGFDFTAAPIMLVFNAIVGGIALASGGLLFARLPSVDEASLHTGGASMSPLIMLPLVLVGRDITGRDTIISAWQILAFGAAYVLHLTSDVDLQTTRVSVESARSYAQHLVTRGRLKMSAYESIPQEADLEDLDSISSQSDADSKCGPAENMMMSPWPVLRMIAVAIAGLGWILLLTHTISEPARLLGYYSSIDHSPGYEPLSSYGLDVVVSYHDEHLEAFLHNLNAFLAIPVVAARTNRVFLYAKDASLSNEELNATLAGHLPNDTQTIVQDLPNVGREGETYLTHILDSWDELADHTLFLQAEMHNPWYMQQRIAQYYLPRTGFLSLWHMETYCDSCDTCRDQSTWNESPAVLKDVFAQANDGAECRDLVLTFRGQFIASAQRIRSNGKELYEGLRERFWDVFEETGNENPLWGYTMERLWGTVMRCPGSKRIADRCPSLASGLIGKVGAVDGCQCIDSDTP